MFRTRRHREFKNSPLAQGNYNVVIPREYYINNMSPTAPFSAWPPGNQQLNMRMPPIPMNLGYNPNVFPNHPNLLNSYAGQANFMNPGYTQNIFQNPLIPMEESGNPYLSPGMAQPGMNHYPLHSSFPKQPGGFSSLMNSFKAKDGTLDINKMVNTAGQMVSAISQVSSLVKGFGGFLKV